VNGEESFANLVQQTPVGRSIIWAGSAQTTPMNDAALPLGLKAVSERLPVVIIVITFLLFGIRDSAT
jgi:hypothetical protein